MTRLAPPPTGPRSPGHGPLTWLRRLTDELREFPATTALCVLWVVVFGVMVAGSAARGPGGLSAWRVILGPVVGAEDGHRAGDMTIRDLEDGEVWRSLTATFVHFGLVHIGLNLWALYQLGSLVESWYGTGPLLAIYVLTGGGGNLLSGAVRRALPHDPAVHVAGGSTVVMGLVALCAVVGWRSRTRVGEHLRSQMIWALTLTAGVGVGLSVAGFPVIDNWGHACGALVGAAVGLAHRAITRNAGRLPARLAGVFGTLALSASAFALVSDDHNENRLRLQTVAQARQRLASDERLIFGLERVRATYRATVGRRLIVRGTLVPARPPRAYPGPVAAVTGVAVGAAAGSGPPRPDPEQEFAEALLNATLRYLQAMTGELDAGANSDDFRRARRLLNQTLYEPPTLEEVREFDDRLTAILARIRADHESARRQGAVAMARG